MSTDKKKKHSEKFTFEDEVLYQKICGINDSGLRELETKLEVNIIPRGLTFILEGDKSKLSRAIEFLKQLIDNYKKHPNKKDFDDFEMNYLMKKEGNAEAWSPTDKVLVTYRGRAIFPKSKNQEILVSSLAKNLITFSIGPAGTGKTFLSIAMACRMLQNGEVEKLILTRPAVEAGENLGFLPGDLIQKVDPYLRPIYDALYECIGYERVQVLISLGKIEIAPIAFMRGRTLANSFIILDEAQNCTMAQLKMFLTRFGKNSKMSIAGDTTQVDLAKGQSGLARVISILKDTSGIGIINLNREDITRHPIVEVIVSKFENI